MRHADRRPTMGGALLPESQRETHGPEHLRPNRGGMREEAGPTRAILKINNSQRNRTSQRNRQQKHSREQSELHHQEHRENGREAFSK